MKLNHIEKNQASKLLHSHDLKKFLLFLTGVVLIGFAVDLALFLIGVNFSIIIITSLVLNFILLLVLLNLVLKENRLLFENRFPQVIRNIIIAICSAILITVFNFALAYGILYLIAAIFSPDAFR